MGGISGESTQVSCLSEVCIKDITGFIVMVGGGGWWVWMQLLGRQGTPVSGLSEISEICIKDITGFIVMVVGVGGDGGMVGGYFGRDGTQVSCLSDRDMY